MEFHTNDNSQFSIFLILQQPVKPTVCGITRANVRCYILSLSLIVLINFAGQSLTKRWHLEQILYASRECAEMQAIEFPNQTGIS